MKRYTLTAPARFVLEVKKSRFLAHAISIDSPQQALRWLKEMSDPQATHNCWAYRIGAAYRFSDDGEPGGTAGRPIFSAIDGQELDHVMVLVTRWYGGINLGAGGLVRAYGGAAGECLRSAPRRELIEKIEAQLSCEFALSATVHALLTHMEAEKLAETFDEHGLHLRLRLPASMFDTLRQRLCDLSRGTAILRHCETISE